MAPSAGSAAYLHGWAAVFPPDAPPVWERFTGLESELVGATASMRWDVRVVDPGGPTLYTFPRYVWERNLLPSSQVVPAPSAVYEGTFAVAGRTYVLDGARGASARIYGHGNAKRWAWLHADLGGGDVLEVVSAVSTRPGLSLLPPLTFVQLRVDGRDLQPDPLLGAPLLRARLQLPTWKIRGLLGRHLLKVTVTQDPDRSIAVPYTDPDGATATCHNSEVASAVIELGSRRWVLDGTAHAEIGVRP